MKNSNQVVFSALLSLILINCIQLNLSAQSVPLKWVNFSPYTYPWQDPNQNDSIPDSQIICLLDTLAPWVEGIRIFGTQNGLQNIPVLAKERGLNVIVGIWLGKEDTPEGIIANEQQVANGIAIANGGYADKLIVGSEVLLRGDLSPSKLIDYITQVQLACPTVPVSCADICSELIAHPQVVDVCDFVAPNIYPFWNGIPIECAMVDFHQCYLQLLPVTDGKEIFISESGWKTEGASVGLAEPSLANAIRYNRELLFWSQAIDVEVCLFSAFDEPWKLTDDGWGIFYNDKSMKPGMDTLFTAITNLDTTWFCEELMNLSTDTLFVDYIPPIGSSSLLYGHVENINPCDYKIATYIKVNGFWWTKPTFDNPTVPIFCNGQWNVDFTTGGQDSQATDICIFVVPCDYIPPLCGGNNCVTIPEEIYQNSIDWECIHRYELVSAELEVSADTICSGGSVTLTASGGTHYLWETGDTTASITFSPMDTPYSSISVEISDGMGGGSILTKQILVIDYSLNIQHESVICPDDSTTLLAWVDFSYPLNYSFLWGSGETTQSIVVYPTSPSSTYNVTVVSTGECTDSDTAAVNLEESSLYTSDDTICIGQSVYLSAWGISFLWSTGDTTSSINVTPDTTTIFSVEVTTNAGCVFQLKDTIVVYPYPTGTISAFPSEVCLGDTALLVAQGGVLYDWLGSEFDNIDFTTDSVFVSPAYSKIYSVDIFNEGTCKTTASVDLTVLPKFTGSTIAEICDGDYIIFNNNPYYMAGTYTDTLSASNGCDSIVSLELSVLPNFTDTTIAEICAGELYIFNGITYNFTGVYIDIQSSQSGCDSILVLDLTVLPNFTDTTIAEICIGNSVMFNDMTYDSTGVYIDTLISQNSCDSILVFDLTVADSIELVLSADQDTIFPGETVSISVSGTGSNLSYLWSTGETTALIQVLPIITTEYFVTVTNSGGCIKYDSLTIYVQSTVSTEDLSSIRSLDIHPNPTNGVLQIKVISNETEPVNFYLLNGFGQTIEMRSEMPNSGEVTSSFNLAGIPKGVYFIKVQLKSGEVRIEKILNQ